jgi:hypothetical protein
MGDLAVHMTIPEDDDADLAALRTTDDDIALLVPSQAELDHLHAERAHRAWLIAEADRRGLVSRRRVLFLQGRAPVRLRGGERRDTPPL